MPFIFYGQSMDQNYKKTTIYKVATTQSIVNPQPSQAAIQMIYYDGLGRPVQQIDHRQSALGNDVITPIAYDAFGRQTKEYLSYPTTTASLDYVSTALDDVLHHSDYEGQNPYTEKVYESSPFNRVLKQASPGTDWALGAGNEIEIDYQFNDTLSVKLYKAVTSWNGNSKIYDISLQDLGFYSSNQLYKTILKNENWQQGDNNTTQEFKDKEGNIVLKRTFDNGEVFDTYYVYDIYGNLTYVIPPLVTSISTQLNSLCYQYKYDARNRLAEKKLPGKDWEFIVYDQLNRPVLTGPAFTPFGGSDKGWLYTKYDAYNRVCFTGWFKDSSIESSRSYQQNIYTTNAINNATRTNSIIDGISINYSNVDIPNNLILLTVTYYDDYNFPNAPTPSGTILNQPVMTKVKGLATGMWVRVLTIPNETAGESSYTIYDDKSRPIVTFKYNYMGGYTQIYTAYNFLGQVVHTETKHKKLAAIDGVIVIEDYEYTLQGRLLNHIHKVNNNPRELLLHNTYNEIGQLVIKNVGGLYDSSNTTGLQKVDYTYNIRGWLTGINDIEDLAERDAANPNDLFAFKINFNKVEDSPVDPLYNGNISETYWRTSSDNIKRKYSYQYDSLNRLNNAIYQKEGIPDPNYYGESIFYDKNGNIKALVRNGELDTGDQAIIIDNLNYAYDDANFPNRLMKVTDETNDHGGGFNDDSDGFNDTTDDYGYDTNGNLNKDENKGINLITYNHLNLPTQIQFDLPNEIDYIYNAIGQKVKKIVKIENQEAITHYLDGYQYKGNVLAFFPTSEGYVNYTNDVLSLAGGKYNYVYNYLDHLGNVRLSYTLDPQTQVLKIIEENQYYPFGLKHNYNLDRRKFVNENALLKIKPVPSFVAVDNNYKFSGKELQEELSLNLYDFGARNYDPAIGRWMNIDPLAEKFNSSNSYNYALNNPVYYNDSDGLEPTPYEAALMAAHVYGNSGITLVGGWGKSTITNFNSKDRTGLKCSMYERTKGDGTMEFAFVYAGTDGLNGRDWKNNLTQVIGLSSQYDKAISLAKQVSGGILKNNEVTFIGHSLGGGLSNLSSLVTGRTSITFNPAWISRITLMNLNQAPLFGGNHITNYVHESDPLDRIQRGDSRLLLKEIGETIELDGEFWDGLWDGHFIGEMVDTLEDNDMNERHERDRSDKIEKPSAEKGFFNKFKPWEWDNED